MAKRILLFLALPVLLCIALLTAGGSETGTRVLAGLARDAAGGALGWRELRGRLLGSLHIDGLAITLPGTDVRVESLDFAWLPLALLRGQVEIERLQVDGLDVVLSPADTPAETTAPFDPASLRAPLDIRLQQLQIDRISVTSGDSPPVVIERISAAISAGDSLVLRDLRVAAPEGGLEASGSIGLDAHLPLDLDATWHWQLPDQRSIGGHLLARGNAGNLQVSHSGSGDLPVNLHGELQSLLDQPAWTINLDWPALPLATGERALVIGPGTLASRGSIDLFSLSGEGAVSGATPETLHWSLQADKGSISGLHLTLLRLQSTPGSLELSGDIGWEGPVSATLDYRAQGLSLDVYSPSLPPQLEASGRINGRYVDSSAQLTRFDLALADSPLRLALSGDAQFPAGGVPVFQASLQWTGLAWPLAQLPGDDSATPPAFSSPAGHLNLSGTSEDYRVALVASSAGSQAPPADWQLQGRGNLSSLQVETLKARLLDGQVRLHGDIAWAPTLRWQLDAEGEKLDPGQWLADYPGQLALALRTTGSIDPQSGPDASVDLAYLRGQLAAQDFALTAQASVRGDAVDLAGLSLHSGDNQLSASGLYSPSLLKLQWQLDAPQPGGLLPGAEGSLSGHGTLSGTPQNPQLEMQLNGDALAFDGQSLEQLRADIRAGLAPDAPLAIELRVSGVSNGDQRLLETAAIHAAGTIAEHSLDLALDTPTDQLHMQLTGGLDRQAMAWTGYLSELLADSASLGTWRLQSPSPLQLSAQSQRLEDACLTTDANDSAAPPRLCASAQHLADGAMQFSAQLEEMPVARFVPTLGGNLEGTVRAGVGSNGELEGSGDFSLSPGDVLLSEGDGRKAFRHRGGALEFDLDPSSGLAATFNFDGERQQLLDAKLQLPQLRRLPLTGPQPLAGQVNADISDLSGISVLVPALSNVSGRLFSDLQLAGDLGEPQLQGTLSLSNAAADVSSAGLQLRDVNLQLASDPERPGYLFLTGGASSGPGKLSLDAQVDVADRALDLALGGNRFEVWDTRDGRALLSPDLQLQWDGETATVRGRLEIPSADITPKLAISPAMASTEAEATDTPQAQVIATSADVVILGADGEALEGNTLKAPFRLDSKVEIALGDRVRVNALGLKGRIAGTATFTNRPRRRELIPIAEGRYSIEEGTFRAFGQDLEIETGQVIFDRVPADRPELALRAVRWIDNDPLVSAAGVQVSGPLDQPLLELFSRPQLDASEIQSYLLTGHSAGSDDSVLGIGTYLHPRLYVGYGYNLIAETSEFDALFTITPRYGIEATAGEADNRVNLTFTHER
ncbi:translocation/assembly module TamB domain-containing protein [Haliea sp. E17]|uniref:translocation/assembly module TamB domain-containing protein n=1 Tax=Haliea sp. E17 TaxID=3401576 RepID=UPI003AABBB61